MRESAAALAGGLALLLAVAGNAVSAADAPAGLEGVDWQLKQYRAGTALQPAASGRGDAVLRFDGGRMTGSAGCNRLMGAYRADGTRLTFEPRIASTMMACPPPLMAQEQAVTDALAAAAGFSIDAGRLQIRDAAGATLLVFGARERLSLTGTRWRLVAYNNGKQAVVSADPGTAFTLQLGDDGQLAGRACNTYRGGFEQDGKALRLVGPIAATRMACPEPAMAQEAAYFAALERVAAFAIDGDGLTLADADGSTLAKFRAEPAAAKP